MIVSQEQLLHSQLTTLPAEDRVVKLFLLAKKVHEIGLELFAFGSPQKSRTGLIADPAVEADKSLYLSSQVAGFFGSLLWLDPTEFLHNFGLDETPYEIFVFTLVEELVEGLLAELGRFILRFF